MNPKQKIIPLQWIQEEELNSTCTKIVLTELDLVPRMGDFVGYDDQYFEILRAGVPNFVFSYPQTKLGVILRCLSVREGVFDPDRDFVNKEYVGDAG